MSKAQIAQLIASAKQLTASATEKAGAAKDKAATASTKSSTITSSSKQSSQSSTSGLTDETMAQVERARKLAADAEACVNKAKEQAADLNVISGGFDKEQEVSDAIQEAQDAYNSAKKVLEDITQLNGFAQTMVSLLGSADPQDQMIPSHVGSLIGYATSATEKAKIAETKIKAATDKAGIVKTHAKTAPQFTEEAALLVNQARELAKQAEECISKTQVMAKEAERRKQALTTFH